MALAEKLLADEFNRPGHTIVDHRTYVFLGDGCLMEGISHEACSLAGAWRLDKLIALYDDNGISIDGPVDGWFTDDTPARFRAYGWNVIGPIDGHDVAAVDQRHRAGARRSADAADADRLPHDDRQGLARAAPARQGARRAARRRRDRRDARGARLDRTRRSRCRATCARAWDARERGAAREARVARALRGLPRRASRRWPPNSSAAWRASCRADFEPALRGRADRGCGHAAEAVATRKASQKVLDALAPRLPELLGGSADLTGSNLTDFPGCGVARGGATGGHHMNYGVREFGMAAIMNGIALHGGFIPYGGTFLTFSDYSRNAIRMAALMKQRVIHVFTHDSIGLGEDGPTHQPVEHAASLRLIPNLDVWRPCDALETAVAWAQRARRGATARARCCCRARTCRAQDAHAPSRCRHRARRLRAERPRGRGGRDHRHRLRSGARARRRSSCSTHAASPVRVVSMPSIDVFDRQDARLPRQRARPRPAAHRRRGRRHALVGQVRLLRGAAASTASANRRRPPRLFEHFGLTAAALADRVQADAATAAAAASAKPRHEAADALRLDQLRSRRHARRHRRRDRRGGQPHARRLRHRAAAGGVSSRT